MHSFSPQISVSAIRLLRLRVVEKLRRIRAVRLRRVPAIAEIQPGDEDAVGDVCHEKQRQDAGRQPRLRSPVSQGKDHGSDECRSKYTSPYNFEQMGIVEGVESVDLVHCVLLWR